MRDLIAFAKGFTNVGHGGNSEDTSIYFHIKYPSFKLSNPGSDLYISTYITSGLVDDCELRCTTARPAQKSGLQMGKRTWLVETGTGKRRNYRF